MKQMIDGFFLAIQFLTTLPFHHEITWDKWRVKWSVRAFPLIGIIAGLLLTIQLFLFMNYTPFSELFMSLWLLFFGVLFTGGLHLDGWMDMSDAVFSYRDTERKLEIMSDSRVGAFGVISLLFLLSFRFLFIYEILQFMTMNSLILIAMIPCLSRTAAGMLLITGKPAKATGMAAAYNGFLAKNELLFIVSFVIAVTGLLIFFENSLLRPFIVLIPACLIFYFLAKYFFSKQFGGITGDTIGALLEGEETFLWFILWLLHSFAMV